MHRLRSLAVATLAVLALGSAGAGASPFPFAHGGTPPGGGGGGSVYAVDPDGTGVRADFSSGQAFVQWPDTATGATGANFRYRMYRNTSARPTDLASCTAGTLIASRIFNNSGQLIGGNPDVASGSTFTQANRQANNSSNPLAIIPDMNLGTTQQLTYGTGLQVYTALAGGTGYYCVVSTNTSDASPTYVGSVGPITETAATPKPVLYTHRTAGNYHITNDVSGNPTNTANLPMVFIAHASSSSGGAAGLSDSVSGDYWTQWGDRTQGYQDGRQAPFVVLRDGVGSTKFSNLANSVVVENRDTVWSPDGLGAMETLHFGQAYTPNPLVGAANKFYPVTQTALSKFLKSTASYYGADLTKLHWQGHSMGAWGGAVVGIRNTDPQFASVWLEFPVWKAYQHGCSLLAGYSIWTSTMPFKATVAAAPCTVGTDPTAVQFNDNSSWGDYDDTVAYASAHPEAALPFIAWTMGKDDAAFTTSPPTNFIEDVQAVAAFQAGHHAHVFAWDMGHHDATAVGAYNKDASGADTLAYSKTLFSTTTPMFAFDSSTIDDNPGTGTRDANGIYDGDVVGCINCGYTWSVSSDTTSAFNFTIGNGWMSRPATTIPTATMVDSIPSSGTAGSPYAVNSTAGWLTVNTANANMYVRIGNEIVEINSKAGNALTVIQRAALGTTAQSHSPGETATQYPSQPTGPNIGAQTSMTVNVTPRRVQNFVKTSFTCSITPNLGGTTTQTPTVTSGVWTLPLTINASGVTSVSCS